MRKLAALSLGAILCAGALPVPAAAAMLGPDAAACERPGAPAMIVRVEGLKSRTGTLRVQSYGGDPERYFDKGTYLRRIEVPVPAAGPVDVCVPVARPGTYAVSVRHDPDGDASGSKRSDGGGISGNPRLSLFDVMLHHKPDPAQVGVRVRGPTRVPVILNYVQGLSFGPVGDGRS